MSLFNWTRIEATTRTVGLSGGLEARIADPLWMLARQWQVGEFHGDDAAQPAAVRTTFRSVAVDLPTGAPLEEMVESVHEPDSGAAGLYAAARGGRRLMWLLRSAGLGDAVAALVDAFPLRLPTSLVAVAPHGTTTAMLLARHGLDAVAVAAASSATLVAAMSEVASSREALAVIDAWSDWFRARAGPPENASWNAERLEYSFDASAPTNAGPVALTAPEHTGGRLDWHSFDVVSQPGSTVRSPVPAPFPSTGPEPLQPSRSVGAVPTPVRYHGMPAGRWWEFEDRRVNFGGIEAGPADLSRLLVAEFATSYSDDWFVVPVRLKVGSLTEVMAVRVVDNFGDRSDIASTATGDVAQFGTERPWRLFELTGDEVSDDHPSPWLFMPPTVAGDVAGPVLERVSLARDEGANLVWGIEKLVEGPAGRSVARADAWHASHPDPPPTTVAADPRADPPWPYRLEAPAPPWWIPFIPERVRADGPEVRLRRARMQSWETLGGGQAGPQSELLDSRRPCWLYEEEVPASGVLMERRWRFARWHDGSYHLWLERSKRPGRGERSSGVRWDLIDIR
jgi:hypothetical protein